MLFSKEHYEKEKLKITKASDDELLKFLEEMGDWPLHQAHAIVAECLKRLMKQKIEEKNNLDKFARMIIDKMNEQLKDMSMQMTFD